MAIATLTEEASGYSRSRATFWLRIGAARIRYATKRLPMSSSTDRIEKKIVLRAPRARVWRALTDAKEFGTWFGMRFEGAFAPGAAMRGRLTPTAVDPGG